MGILTPAPTRTTAPAAARQARGLRHTPATAFLASAFRGETGQRGDPERARRRWATGRLLLQATGLWLITRCIYAALTVTALIFGGGESLTSHIAPAALVRAWVQFDATFYLRIAAEGYTRANKVDDCFLPLYPLLIHGGSLLFGAQNADIVALIIANLALLGAFAGLALLARHDAPATARIPAYTLLTLTAYPLAFFLSAPWTDGVFLCFAVWTLYGIRTRRWGLAASITLLAILTRVSGLTLVPPLVVGYVLAQWPRDLHALAPKGDAPRAASQRASLPIAIARGLASGARLLRSRAYHLLVNCVGTWRRTLVTLWVIEAPILAVLLLLAMYYIITGDAFIYFARQQSEFGHVTLPPWQTLALLWRQITVMTPLSYRVLRVLVDAIPLALAALFLVCFALPWRVPLRRRWRERLAGTRRLAWLARLGAVRPMPLAHTIYMAGIVALCVAQPVVHVEFPNIVLSSGRYLTAAVPLWLALGRWVAPRPLLQALLLGGGWALQALLLGYYLQGGWLV